MDRGASVKSGATRVPDRACARAHRMLITSENRPSMSSSLRLKVCLSEVGVVLQ